jgi:hypothetical protein
MKGLVIQTTKFRLSIYALISKIRLKPGSIIKISKSYPLNILLYLIAKPSEYENSKEYSPV